MRIPLGIGVIFGLLVVPAFARLDETEAQLIERYGQVRIRTNSSVAAPSHRANAETLVFCIDGWTVTAMVVDGRCKGISYVKPGEWTDEQLWHILEANGGHAQWEEIAADNPDSKRQWKRRDHTIAIWQKSQGLQLLSPINDVARESPGRKSKGEVSVLADL